MSSGVPPLLPGGGGVNRAGDYASTGTSAGFRVHGHKEEVKDEWIDRD
jgi:hypothetical protein